MFACTADRAFRRYQRHGQAAALALVFDRTAPELLRLARHLAARGVAAEDLVQQTFLTAIERKDRYDPRAPVLPWLCGILTNHAHAARRATRRLPDPLRLPLGAADPADEAATGELANALELAIARAPEPYRPVLRLHLQHGLEPAEIARSLERPDGTVRAQLHRGLDHLRRLLPPGIAAAAAGAMAPAAALAKVRAVVVQQCGGPAGGVVSTAVTLGVLLMFDKKLLIGVAAAALLLLPFAFPPSSPPPAVAAPTSGPAVATAAPGASSPPVMDAVAADRDRVEPAASPAPAAPPAPTTGSLRVQVVDQTDGSPLAGMGVAVVAVAALQNPGSRRRFVPTNAEGEAVFTDLEPGHRLVEVDRSGDRSVTKVVAGTASHCRIAVTGVRVVGRVVDQNGAPVPDATLWMHANRVEALPIAVADAAGRFTVDHLAPKLTIQARREGLIPSAAHLVNGEPGSTHEMTMELGGRGATVTGWVRDDRGRPAKDVLVYVVPESDALVTPYDVARQPRALQLRTDADGNFATEEAPLGKQIVTACSADDALAPDGKLITTGPSPVHVELHLVRAAVLEGRITASGAPLSGCDVHVFCEQPDQPVSYLFNLIAMRTAASDQDGRYRVTGIVPGKVQIRVLRTGLAPIATERRTLGPAERLALDFATGGGATLTVRVTPPAPTTPRPIWMVTVRREGSEEIGMQITGPDGLAHLADLKPGTYRVDVIHQPAPSDHLVAASTTVEVTDSATACSIEVPAERHRLQPLRGRLVDAARAPVADTTVLVRGGDGTSIVALQRTTTSDGTFALAGVPMGPYRLERLVDGQPFLIREFTMAGDRAEDLGDLVVPTR